MLSRLDTIAPRLGALARAHGARLFRFALVGAANTVIDFTVFACLYYLAGLPLLLANSLGYGAGLTNSFLMNSRWTFRDPERTDRPTDAARFAAFNVVGLALANAVIWVLALVLPVWAAKLGAVAAPLLWNYWSSQRFVFARD